MQRRGGFYGVALAFGCGAACSAPVSTAPVPTAPSAVTLLPAPSASAAAPVVSTPPAPPQHVWTTPEQSNVCTEYERAPLYTPTYETREACEEWVKARSCQPGFSCFDGCNWRTCTDRGDGMNTTLLGCHFGVVAHFEFQTNATKLSPEPDWAGGLRVCNGPCACPSAT
jgi:hypothetical protein